MLQLRADGSRFSACLLGCLRVGVRLAARCIQRRRRRLGVGVRELRVGQLELLAQRRGRLALLIQRATDGADLTVQPVKLGANGGSFAARLVRGIGISPGLSSRLLQLATKGVRLGVHLLQGLGGSRGVSLCELGTRQLQLLTQRRGRLALVVQLAADGAELTMRLLKVAADGGRVSMSLLCGLGVSGKLTACLLKLIADGARFAARLLQSLGRTLRVSLCELRLASSSCSRSDADAWRS